MGTISNNDFRIQKDRLAAVLVTVGGERLAGELFVQASPRNRYGREEAADILNSAEPFFPMLMNDGALFIVAKDRVRELESRDPMPAENGRLARPPRSKSCSLVERSTPGTCTSSRSTDGRACWTTSIASVSDSCSSTPHAEPYCSTEV
jgi:hypothetical protein